MTADELKSIAVKLLPMPEGLSAAEQMYFTTMRNLAFDWRAKRISSEQVRKESIMARREFDHNQFELKLWHQTMTMWQKIEALSVRYAKEHTIELADEFYRTVYGLGENWRAVRPREEIENEN